MQNTILLAATSVIRNVEWTVVDDWVWKEMFAPSFGTAAHEYYGGLAYGTRQVYIAFICDIYIFEPKLWSKLFCGKLNEN